ncbi:hypothetical protein lbkm_0226 [Lachnospiraceae bacterium KM106-2]|nr:hypothetical protein lbkm_0226 [Lachnospiraceae bacterium KM106-2]
MFKKKEFVSKVMDSGFIFIDRQTKEKALLEFNVEKIPNTPFYYSLFEKEWGYGDEMRNWIKAVKGLKGSKLTMIVSDDLFESDQILIRKFFKTYGKIKKIEFVTPNQYLSGVETNYIAITQSNRALTASYIKDGQVWNKKYYDVHNYLLGEVIEEIKGKNSECEYQQVPILYNGFYCDMENAVHVTKEDILNHYIDRYSNDKM